MPLTRGPDEVLLSDSRGVPVGGFRWREHEGEQVVSRFRAMLGASPDRAARLLVAEVPGHRITTSDDDTAQALIGAGCLLIRAATDLERDTEALAPPVLAGGWELTGHSWAGGLDEALRAAYPPEHPDHGDRKQRLTGLIGGDDPLTFLPEASARLRDPSGRVLGHVFTVGPVSWSHDCSWVLDLAIAPAGRGHGFGAALLAYAIRGTYLAGLSRTGLTVTDGNPARRLYERTGYRPAQRSIILRAPA